MSYVFQLLSELSGREAKKLSPCSLNQLMPACAKRCGYHAFPESNKEEAYSLMHQLKTGYNRSFAKIRNPICIICDTDKRREANPSRCFMRKQ